MNEILILFICFFLIIAFDFLFKCFFQRKCDKCGKISRDVEKRKVYVDYDNVGHFHSAGYLCNDCDKKRDKIIYGRRSDL